MTGGDDRPDWAQRLGLPCFEHLRYAQALAWCSIGLLLFSYVVARAIGDPAVLLRAARKKVEG